MLKKHYADESGAFILLQRDDMAAMTGISLETVSRMIAEFKREGMLYISRDNFYMCDEAALQEVAS
jgi:DNA-binding transcriptional regulator YhcF (GntR family)